jgi:hypothetical protein
MECWSNGVVPACRRHQKNIHNNIPALHYSISPICALTKFSEMLLTMNYFLTVVLLFIFSQGTFAQTKTNLEIFYSLVDSSVNKVIMELPGNDSISLELNLGESYSVFSNKIIAALYSSGKKIAERNSSGKLSSVNFVIDNINTGYGEMFRNGFLGDYMIPRNLSLGGNFIIQKENPVYRNFNFIFTDTVRVDEVKTIENESFPFTRGKILSEPFFSGIFEPVIAIGTAALAVILFFTIRSK